MRQFKEQFGFLTIAQNTDVDYLHLAYLQAQNIKATQQLSSYAVIVDSQTAELVTDSHRKVFDYVITLSEDMALNETWKQANEWQVFGLTPFKETIKLESDLLLTRDIAHWLDCLRLKEICFSYNCKNYQGETVVDSPYRKFHKLNNLPNIYTGMYYFRYSQFAFDFFKVVREIYTNWSVVREQYIQCDLQPSTDTVMSIAARIVGEENCYIPSLDFFNFAHMKPGIQGWSDSQPWTDHVNIEQHHNMLRINNLNQYYPVHYYEKNFIS